MNLSQRVREELADLIYTNHMEEGEIEELAGSVRKIVLQAIEADRKSLVLRAEVGYYDEDNTVAYVDEQSILYAPLPKGIEE